MREYIHPRKQTAEPKPIFCLVDLPYPYWKQRVYMNTSLWSVAAALQFEYDVQVLDLNIERWGSKRAQQLIKTAQVFGFSPTGGPNAPDLLKYCRKLKIARPEAPVLVGGQWTEGLAPWEFDVLMAGTNAVQFLSQSDWAKAGVDPDKIELFTNPMAPVLDKHPKYRDAYLMAPERALVLSRGCNKKCEFCGALNGVPEKFFDITSFWVDLNHQIKRAKELGLEHLEYYLTSLDLFQNPETVADYLELIGAVSAANDFPIKLRGLSCMNSFIRASWVIPNLAELCRKAGLWCLGFGIDGIRKEVWQKLGKGHNHLEDIEEVANLTRDMRIRMEILMFVGNDDRPVTPKEAQFFTVLLMQQLTAKTWPLIQALMDPKPAIKLAEETLAFTTHLLDTHDHTVARIHVAKILTGSKWWKKMPLAIKLEYLCDPTLFYNVDVLAAASPITHPDPKFRHALNKAYLKFLWRERQTGRCVSSTIWPQGGDGLAPLGGRLANPYMRFDR